MAAAPSLQSTLRRTVDPHFGIANTLLELAADPLAPDVFVSLVDGGAPSYFIETRPEAWLNCSNGSGAAYTREGALWATLGEMLERYCAAIYSRAGLIQSTGRALGDKALPIKDMILFASAQYKDDNFPFTSYDATIEQPWVAGRNMATGAPIYAPAQLLYLSHEWANEMLMQTVSTGLACHCDPEAARLSALLELIERDGFASAWAVGMPLPVLNLSAADRARLSPETLRALDHETLKLSLHAIPNAFGVANIFVFVEHVALGMGVVGGATKLCPYEAIEKAVLEALHGWIGFTRAATGQYAFPAAEDIQTPHDHALHYMQPAAWQTLKPFRDSAVTLTPAELCAAPPMRASNEVVARLRDHGFEAYLFDLTTEDVSALGFEVVRAIVPGLQPLSFGQLPVSEDRRRLAQNCAVWGWDMPDRLVTAPHPFP